MPTVGNSSGLGPWCWEQRQGEGWAWVDEGDAGAWKRRTGPWMKLEEQIT